MKEIYNACDPSRPAGVGDYMDCSTARGSKAVVREFVRSLDLSTGHLKFLFSGHVGCGKSSELRHLSRVLRERRHFTVFLDGDEYLDDYDTNQVDLVLAILVQVSQSFRMELAIDLSDRYLSSRWQELKELLGTDVDLEGAQASGVKIGILKKDPGARQRVRQALLPRQAGLIEDDIFSANEPWYAVNPVVRELTKFQAAVTRLRTRGVELRGS